MCSCDVVRGRGLAHDQLGWQQHPFRPRPTRQALERSTLHKLYPFSKGEPEDIAAIAVFLASDEARMLTGTTIAADGGRSSYLKVYAGEG